MNILFFDFETTGLDTKVAYPTEMAFAAYSSKGERLSSFQSLIYPKGFDSVDPEITNKTGITIERLKTWGMPLEEVMAIFLQYLIKCNFLCAHNYNRYDGKILERVGPKFPSGIVCIDTLTDIKYKNVSKSRKLVHLVAEHERPVLKAHRAMNDVEMLADLFFQYDVATTFERAKTPLKNIKANVTRDLKDRAKELNYFWDWRAQIWYKQIREYDLDAEKELAKDKFTISILPETYFPPEQ